MYLYTTLLPCGLRAGKCVYNVHAGTGPKMELSATSLSGYALFLLLLLLPLLNQSVSCLLSHGATLLTRHTASNNPPPPPTIDFLRVSVSFCVFSVLLRSHYCCGGCRRMSCPDSFISVRLSTGSAMFFLILSAHCCCVWKKKGLALTSPLSFIPESISITAASLRRQNLRVF